MSRPRDQFEVEMLAAVPKLRATAAALTKNPDQAADLVQDTLAKAWTARGSFELGTNMVAWLSLIARNQFYSDRRRAWRWQQPPIGHSKSGEAIELFEQMLTVGARQHHKLELDDLLEALSYLPSEQRDAILLIGEGLSYDEAAGELATSAGTIKSRVSRARAALDAYFQTTVEELT